MHWEILFLSLLRFEMCSCVSVCVCVGILIRMKIKTCLNNHRKNSTQCNSALFLPITSMCLPVCGMNSISGFSSVHSKCVNICESYTYIHLYVYRFVYTIMAIASVSFAHRCWCIGGAMKLHSKKAAALLPISIWTYFSHLFGFHLLLGFCFSLSLLWSPPLFLSTTKYVVWIFQYIWNTRIKYIWNEPEKRHKNTKMQSLHLLLFVGLRLFSYKFVSIYIYCASFFLFGTRLND